MANTYSEFVAARQYDDLLAERNRQVAEWHAEIDRLTAALRAIDRELGRTKAALASARDAIRIVVDCELLDSEDSTLGQLRAVLADTAGQEDERANT